MTGDSRFSAYADRTVLITGATGFIGGRIAERLALDHGAHVRALVRSFGRAARLARLPVELTYGELGDPASLSAAVKGCDVVIHAAFDWRADANNLAGITNLAEACLAHGVRRMVHMSTMAVYGTLPPGDFDEASLDTPFTAYAKSKVTLEQHLGTFVGGRGLPAVVLQPTIVYGPFSLPWTDQPVRRLLAGKLVLPEDPQGLCNAVYVDDVVDASLLAGLATDAIGGRFLISGPDWPTWQAMFESYAQVLGVDGPVLLPAAEIRRRNRTAGLTALRQSIHNPGELIRTLAKSTLRAPLMALYRRLPQGKQAGIRRLYTSRPSGGPAPVFLPNAQLFNLYTNLARARIDKARQVLGYTPRFPAERGLAMTAEYIRWAYPCRDKAAA